MDACRSTNADATWVFALFLCHVFLANLKFHSQTLFAKDHKCFWHKAWPSLGANMPQLSSNTVVAVFYSGRLPTHFVSRQCFHVSRGIPGASCPLKVTRKSSVRAGTTESSHCAARNPGSTARRWTPCRVGHTCVFSSGVSRCFCPSISLSGAVCRTKQMLPMFLSR